MTDLQRIKAIGSHLMDAAMRYNAAVSQKDTAPPNVTSERIMVALDYIESAEALRRRMKDERVEYVALCSTIEAREEWNVAATECGQRS